MSSPSETSSYRPDDSDNDSDFAPSARGRQKQRSTSLAQDFDIEYSTSQNPTQPEIQTEEQDEDPPDSSQSRWERLDVLLQHVNNISLDHYIKTLEKSQVDVPIDTADASKPFYRVAQHGAVVWSHIEKETMFRALNKKGKHGIEQIAATIGTKSVLEVADYLKLLQHSLAERHLTPQRLRTIIMGDIPAAVEVSKECCDELDKYAEAAVLREDIDLEKKTRLLYVDNALISDFQAKHLKSMEVNTPLPGSIHLAANLLNVPNWTQTSGYFFMNFGGTRAEDSWQNLVQSRSETPCIYGDALMDFYALTMSITRRLVQSSIFFALARLRGLDRIGRTRKQDIRKRDVRAAIDVMNMKHNRAGFFINIARQHQLEIVDDSNETDPQTLSYDEAEEALRPRKSAHDSETDVENSASESEEKIDNSNSEATQSKSQPNINPASSSESRSQNQLLPKVPWNTIPLDPEEEHADLLDLENSRCEELKLWDLMGTPAPSKLNNRIPASYHPRTQRKSRDDLADWRDRVLYRSEWEEYGDGTQDLQDDLAANSRKRRLSSHEVETESDIERPRRRKRTRNKSPSRSQPRPQPNIPRPKSARSVRDISSDEEELEGSDKNGEMGDIDVGQESIQRDEDNQVDENEDDHNRMDMDDESSHAPSYIDISETSP
ncbi:hypothetical protein N7478_011209 [Penicillium angulare]|uniref:uncharacterized protein n=1 Tax=Penicillium angulare TaxID=116970 RepID=UPI00253F6887|nr:uncharacterized protein N7478_011209 [Penicillium angulare]KAJ5263604.1 hypothetical protein N7478_011209 [Penicillium angulare]